MLLIKQILNSHRKHRGDDPIDAAEFLKLLKEKSAYLKIPMEMHSRFVNTKDFLVERKKRMKCFRWIYLIQN